MKRLSILFPFLLIGCASSGPIVKNGNFRNCPKTVTVYMDEGAENNFKTARMDVGYVLELVNLNFASQGIDFRYDLRSLKIKKWTYKSADLPKGKDVAGIRYGLYKLQKMKIGFEDDKSDVHIFITDIIRVGSGLASEGWKFWRFGSRGKGSMLVGNSPFFLNFIGYDGWDRDAYLATVASTVAHEQGHLYGLKHVENFESLMNRGGEYGKSLLLDGYSKNKLHDILSIEEKCAAP